MRELLRLRVPRVPAPSIAPVGATRSSTPPCSRREGSAWRAVREAVSLVVAGLRQRLRAESGRSLRDGFGLVCRNPRSRQPRRGAGRSCLGIHHPPLFLGFGAAPPLGCHMSWTGGGLRSRLRPPASSSVWYAATAASLSVRRCANLGIVGYDALFLVNGTDWYSGHLVVFSLNQPGPNVFPVGRYWLAAAIVLVLGTAAAPMRRLPLGAAASRVRRGAAARGALARDLGQLHLPALAAGGDRRDLRWCSAASRRGSRCLPSVASWWLLPSVVWVLDAAVCPPPIPS